MLKHLLRWLWHLLRGLFRAVLALLILFEEWGWEPLGRLMALVGRLPVFKQLEALIRRLPPYAALVVFFIPGVLLLPVKLLALWTISKGHAGFGLLVILLAKIGGTAVVARIFTLTQPALMRLAWFARLYARWTVYKEKLVAWIHASRAWRLARAIKVRMRRLFRRRSSD